MLISFIIVSSYTLQVLTNQMEHLISLEPSAVKILYFLKAARKINQSPVLDPPF